MTSIEKSGLSDKALYKVESLQRFFKQHRNFEVNIYLYDKIDAINKFFSENHLDSAVVGISGGIDSAVVIYLLSEASKRPKSPIKRIIGLSMPIYGNGTTNQLEANTKASLLLRELESKNDIVCGYTVDLTNSYNSYTDTHFHKPNARFIETLITPFANGQLASIVRTPMLYYTAAILQEQGNKSIVVGTTNRDEGSYIGFFGKASDAMVDLQPIADLHKSEVYEVAKRLNVPNNIINAVPAGDVYDGRVDEEMIGAPYWFLELYLQCKCYYGDESDKQFTGFIRSFQDEKDRNLLNQYSDNIEDLHIKNQHKYEVGSPARFIDVLPRKIYGGWQ